MYSNNSLRCCACYLFSSVVIKVTKSTGLVKIGDHVHFTSGQYIQHKAIVADIKDNSAVLIFHPDLPGWEGSLPLYTTPYATTPTSARIVTLPINSISAI
jgi:hypothetical protein